MPNTLLTSDIITKEALVVLENTLGFAKTVNRQYDSDFAQSGAKNGSTLRIRKPNRYVVRSGATLAVQDVAEQSTTLAVATQKGVDMTFTSVDLTLSIDEFSDRFIKPAIATLANTIDFDGLALYEDVYNSTGTPGTTPATALDILNAGEMLTRFATPKDGMRYMTVNPEANVRLVDGMKGFFHAGNTISEQFRTGSMGSNVLGFKDIGEDQNVNAHTVGPLGGTPLVNGASQTGASLVTDGWTAAAAARLNKGDVFTIAGVFSVNPQSRQSTGKLQQFTVTADVSSNASGQATVPISPSIVTSGALQTVTGSPADNAAITVLGAAATAYPQNLAYHRDAFTLVTADLEVPKGCDFAARERYKNMSMRIIRNYDISTDTFPCRLDVLYGWKLVREELAARVWG